MFVAPFAALHVQHAERLESLTRKAQHVCRNPRYPSVSDASGVHVGTVAVRCRKCSGCLRLRQSEWMHRATVEFVSHVRSWWVTYTYSPGQIDGAIYKHIQLAHYRLRKSGHDFRFLCSEEEGERNGRKHYHVLYHDGGCLKRRDFEAVWQLGFTHARLARTAGLGAYLAKYASKVGRIRASLHYGDSYRRLGCVDPEAARQVEEAIRTGSVVRLPWVAVSRWGVEISADRITLPAHHGYAAIPF